MTAICVFLGASSGANSAYSNQAQLLGKTIAEAGCDLVYGGSNTGLMGDLADSAMQAGGDVIGITIQALKDKEFHHTGLTQLLISDDMSERKKKMEQLSDAFIIFPGGCGTYDEFFDVFTWAKLGFHNKPIIILNLEGYFDPLIQLLQHTENEGFMNSWDRELLTIIDDINALEPELSQLNVKS